MGVLFERAEQLNQNYSTSKVNDLIIDICKELENLTVLVHQLIKEKKEEYNEENSHEQHLSMQVEAEKCSSAKPAKKKKK